MIFIHRLRDCTFTGQRRVIIQERLSIKVVNKFIKIRNFGSYFICQNVDDGGSIKVSGCF